MAWTYLLHLDDEDREILDILRKDRASIYYKMSYRGMIQMMIMGNQILKEK